MSKSKYTNVVCLLVIILTIAITVVFMNGSALGLIAVTTDASEDSIASFSSSDLDGTWDADTATYIELSDNSSENYESAYSASGDVTIVSSGTYVLSGELNDHQIIVNAKGCNVHLVLNNVEITNTNLAPIYVEAAEKVYLTLADDSNNQLILTDELSDELTVQDIDAVIYSKSDLAVNGSGTLTVNAETCNGIKSTKNLIIASGTLSVDAGENALVGRNSVRICGGSFSLTAGNDGIKSNNDDDEEKGYILILDGDFHIVSEHDGIQAETDLTIEDGTFDIQTGGGHTGNTSDGFSGGNEFGGFGGGGFGGGFDSGGFDGGDQNTQDGAAPDMPNNDNSDTQSDSDTQNNSDTQGNSDTQSNSDTQNGNTSGDMPQMGDGNMPNNMQDGNTPGGMQNGTAPDMPNSDNSDTQDDSDTQGNSDTQNGDASDTQDGNTADSTPQMGDGNMPNNMQDGNMSGDMEDSNMPGDMQDGNMPGGMQDGNMPDDMPQMGDENNADKSNSTESDSAESDSAESSTESNSTEASSSNSDSIENDSDSSKGLKAGVSLTITDGTFTLDCTDDALHSNGTLTIHDGTFQMDTDDDGIHADDTLLIKDGTITVASSYEGLEAHQITISGGTIDITASDDGCNANGGSSQFGFMGGFGGFQDNNTSSSASDDTANNNDTSDTGSETDDDSDDSLPILRITGGELTVHADGDGLDSNGSILIEGGIVYVDGPSDDGNAALDYGSENGGDCTISNGTVLAIGSSGMAETFSDQSEQCSFIYDFDSNFSAGDELTITDPDGKVLLTYTIQKSGNSVVYSSPYLMLGNTYTITVGDLSAQITLDDTSTSSTGNSKGGGMQQSFDQNMRQNPGNNGSDGSNVDNGSNGGNGGPDNSDTSL